MASYRETCMLLLLAHSIISAAINSFCLMILIQAKILIFLIGNATCLTWKIWRNQNSNQNLDFTKWMCVDEVLQIPYQIQFSNRMKCHHIEAICSLIKRFSVCCRCGDMLPLFGRSVLELNLNSKHIFNFVYNNFGHKSFDMNQNWLTPNKL